MKFSIIIPTFNRKTMVAGLIRRIVAENIADSEVLVIDDCSEDETASFLSGQFPDVKILVNTRRRLAAHSRNRGIRESGGDTLVFMDSDIIFERGALKGFLNDLETGLNFPRLMWDNKTEMPACTSSVFAVQRSALSGFGDSYFDENIGIYSDDTDFFTKARLVGLNFIHKPRYIFVNQRRPNVKATDDYEEFQYYMSYKNNLYISLKFLNLADGHTLSALLKRFGKNLLWVIINLFSLRFKRAYLMFSGIIWNIIHIGDCLRARRELIKTVAHER
jgi:glycosyltransferase involved in cell wall biosynthesis